MQLIQNRRDFLVSLSAAGAAGILGARGALADEPPPEVTTIRLPHIFAICLAPGYIADDLLRAEGFSDIRYVPMPVGLSVPQMVGRGEIDFGITAAAMVAFVLDAGVPVTALSGIHSGCYELFAHDPIRILSDLKGKRVGIHSLSSAAHLNMTVMTSYIGLDPHRDIEWVPSPTGDAMELFAEGQVDAFLGFPPEPQELRARKIGRVVLNTTTDQPWSQYSCCIAFGNREFARDHPVATMRFLRAILKAADICAAEPEMAAQQLLNRGFAQNYDYALQTLTEIPYASWREFDPEDALRFFALRLHEVGMIKSTPNKIIAEGADWRFLNELKRELKA